MKIKIAVMAIICTYTFCGCMYDDIVSEYNSQKNSETIAEATDAAHVTEIIGSGSEKEEPHNNEEETINNDYKGIRYDQLNDSEKTAYKQMCDGIVNNESYILFDVPIKYESLCKAYDAVLMTLDCQMYNPLSGTSSLASKEKQMVYNVFLKYDFPQEETEKIKNEIEQESSNILALLTDDMTETQKEMTLHDELIKKCTYDRDAIAGSEENFQQIASMTHCADAYGAIVEGKAVCEGYARAFKYLCNKAGIKCELVSGMGTSGIGHMWNIVYADGKWHQVDVTYDDPVHTIEGKESLEHNYFNLSDEEMLKDHIIDEDYVVFPECE